jgi:hypothetical protein
VSYRITGKRVPAVHQPTDPARAQREATEAVRLAAGQPPPLARFDDVGLAREPKARRPGPKRSRRRAKALSIRTSHAMYAILRRMAATTGTSVTELVNAAILTAYARAV